MILFAHTQLKELKMLRAACLTFGWMMIGVTFTQAEDDKPIQITEEYDYAPTAKKISAKFHGTPGVFLHLGDSITYANQNTAWARGGQGLSVEEKTFIAWTHGGKRNDLDGWYLASVDVPSGRSHTAASGVRADEYLKGGKGGLPSLAEIVKKYKPQLALYMLGTNDISAGRSVVQYIADVEKAVDLLEEAGTVTILSTLPPYRGKSKEVVAYNEALRELAKKKKLPLIDLYSQMKSRAGEQIEQSYLNRDGIHLSHEKANGPANAENLRTCGYLLRCYLAVHKGMEVKAKVFDAP
jgi:lysophospholipase L1-like esterase